MKRLLLLGVSLLLASQLVWAQVGIHTPVQVFSSTSPFSALCNAGLFDAKTQTLRLDSFEYSADPNVGVYVNNYWIINNKWASIGQWSGSKVAMQVRCTRTRGTDYDVIPMSAAEQDWWAEFVAGKMAIQLQHGQAVSGGWNEHSLGWFVDGSGVGYTRNPDASRNYTDETRTRPERDAICVDLLVSKLRAKGFTNFVVGAPTVHAPNDADAVGYGYTYLKRFFARLPVADRPFVKPDLHLYYGYLAQVQYGIITSEYTDLARCISYLSTLGYKPSDIRVSEFGCFWYSSTQNPTSQQAADRMSTIYATAIRAGVPATSMYAWTDTYSVMKAVNIDGTLTPYGQAIKTLMQTP